MKNTDKCSKVSHKTKGGEKEERVGREKKKGLVVACTPLLKQKALIESLLRVQEKKTDLMLKKHER